MCPRKRESWTHTVYDLDARMQVLLLEVGADGVEDVLAVVLHAVLSAVAGIDIVAEDDEHCALRVPDG